MKTPIDVVFVGPAEEHVSFSSVAQEFGYSFANISDIDGLLASEQEPTLLLISDFESAEFGVDELVQISRQQFPEAFAILFVSKPLTAERSQQLSALGIDTMMLKSERSQAKVGFLISQTLRASFVPFKAVDLVPEHPLPFTVYHLLPLRKKFLPLLREGDKITPSRLERLNENPEFYFRRQDAERFKTYVEQTADKSAGGLAKRCRANFNALQAEFIKLALELSDQCSKVSYGGGQSLLKKCLELCRDLLTNLSGFPQAWEVINGSSIGDFGSLERAPAIAAYCGMFSLVMDLNGVEELMLVSLLLDVGVLNFPESLAKKVREGKECSPEEWADIKKVPDRSLEMVLSRKLPISEKQRSMMMAVYENADGSGYPNGYNDQKLTKESQLIRLAKEFDKMTLFKMGKEKTDPNTAVERILAEPELAKIFSIDFKRILSQNYLGK